MSLLRCSSPMVRLPYGRDLMPGGLRQSALRVADPTREHREQRQCDLWVALEDPAEVPALDPERRGRLDGAGGRRTRELVEEGHLAEYLAGSKRRDLLLLAIAVLDDVDLARSN